MALKDDILTDLDTFLDSDEFAVDITYNSGTIQGIFDNAFLEDQQDDVDIETLQPQVTVKTSDVSGLAHGDTMTIDSVVYNVIGIQPDGTGLTNVLLSQD
ncbi:MAG: hypothetical protein D8M57_13215 [Candidatus Scalindua sp. AMX11]|nr:MAG: hypothetical protein DWQ00_11875 [Candidatus Scalindua sp.]NOG83765.1 hypothetical protein [Planctomycetota bacterium]RZV82924.1 MAG: hypothetical protein EX341_09030 [Candidatus Scalindua sp. SCAELEC01]TDE64454.1 MAG: hypothetical protein D8M57_13215 [Candidatus Scalindua sp. AMX11]GJQ59783.1 MAG: hypothetical protein SCALA701_25840 [Candidatus Scalindua sp.]